MGLHTINIEDKVWTKSMDKFGKGNLSGEIEKMLREKIDIEDQDDSYKDMNILNQADLTKKQKKLASKLIEESNTDKGIGKNKAFNKARDNSIYSESRFFKQALKKLSSSNKVPLKFEDGRVKTQIITCKCDSKLPANGLAKNDGRCVKCDTKLIEFETEKPEILIGE